MSVYREGSEVGSIVFSATDSDKENWFSKDRIIYFPWTDLNTEPVKVFAVKGCCERAFSIFRNYGGCGVDAGWLVITGAACAWESRLPKATVMYSNLGTYAAFNTIGKKTKQVQYLFD